VVEGSHGPLSGSLSKRIADFVHGADGFGEVYHSEPATKALSGITAAEFVVEQCRKYPGQVTFVALASMTNLALALKLEPELDELLKEVVFMGGAFRVNGNVNPAAEANVFADPDAAEFVLSTCSKVAMIGLDLTHKCFLTREEIENLRGKGSHGDFAASIIQFYLRYHEVRTSMTVNRARAVGQSPPCRCSQSRTSHRRATVQVYANCAADGTDACPLHSAPTARQLYTYTTLLLWRLLWIHRW